MEEIKKLLDEVCLTIRDKKIKKTILAKNVGISFRTLTKVLEGKGKVEDLIKVVEYVRGV